MANTHMNISFALVDIPVSLKPAIKNNDTSFNQLHKKCLKRVSYIKYCSHCKKNLKENEIIKGYQFEKDEYITFEKEELNKMKLDNEKEIEIISFVNIKDIDPVYFEKSYVLEKKGKSRSYNLFIEALKKSNSVALCKSVLNGKFYYAILRFMNNSLIMTTLYFEEEINLENNKDKIEVNQKELVLAMKLIESLKGKFEPSKYKDEYQNSIRKAIDSKLNGKAIKGTKKKNKKHIDDLMLALEKSLKK